MWLVDCHELHVRVSLGGLGCQVPFSQLDARAGVRVVLVCLVECELLRRKEGDITGDVAVLHEDLPLAGHVELVDGVQPVLVSRWFTCFQAVVDDHDIGLDEEDRALELLDRRFIGLARITDHGVDLRCGEEGRDSSLGLHGVLLLVLAIDGDAVGRSGGPHPFRVVLAPVDVPVARIDQKPLAVGAEEEGIVGLVTMRLGAEGTGLEDDLHALGGIDEVAVEIGLSCSSEEARRRQIVGAFGLDLWQSAANKADIAVSRGRPAELIDIPLPMRILRLRGQNGHERHIRLRGPPCRKVAEAAVVLARRHQIHRVVAGLREERLLIGVDAHRFAHHIGPRGEAGHIAFPIS